MDELSISERLERSTHLFALGNPSRSLATKDRPPKVIADGVVFAGGAAVFSCANILIVCRMSYFLASERFACFWQHKWQMLNTYGSIPINTRGTAGTPRPWRSTFSRSLS